MQADPGTTAEVAPGSLSNTTSSVPWRYEPDMRPLPKELVVHIREAFRQVGRQLRRAKGSNTCPTLDAITTLFNYLLAGKRPGTRRASQKLLVEMGFNTSFKKRKPIFDVLTAAGMLRRGTYRSKDRSRQWVLDETVVEVFLRDRQSS
jgi:hypothetical protein